jgi:hypothetical protein
MSTGRSGSSGKRRAISVVLLVTGLPFLAACSSTSHLGDTLPTSMGGLPSGAPARSETPGAYPAVHDMPPPRSTAILTEEEQKKLEDDLAAARKRASGAKAAADTTKP